MTKQKVIRVLVADDHTIVRQGLVALINRKRGMKVIAEADNGASAVRQFSLHRPDVSLIDLRMPGMDGVEVIRLICQQHPKANVIVLTTFDDDEDIYRALGNGAKAYLLKDISRDELVNTITSVYNGNRYIPSSVAAKLASRVAMQTLTRRELDVLTLLVSGKSNKEIANELSISEGTIKLHVNHILRKLKAQTRTEAATIAVKKGFIRLN
jgi:DNA-binding NarL/FixJ family response regulator